MIFFLFLVCDVNFISRACLSSSIFCLFFSIEFRCLILSILVSCSFFTYASWVAFATAFCASLYLTVVCWCAGLRNVASSCGITRHGISFLESIGVSSTPIVTLGAVSAFLSVPSSPLFRVPSFASLKTSGTSSARPGSRWKNSSARRSSASPRRGRSRRRCSCRG